MLKHPATWTAALIVTGLPVFLFYNSINSQYTFIQLQSNDEIEKIKKVNSSRLIKQPKAIISRDKGLLTRCIATTSSFTAIVAILFKFYNKPSNESKEAFINFSVCSWIFHWNAIMIEMTLSGPQYFSSRNISNIWQVLMSCNQHWRVRFIKHNSNQTRKKAFYQLLSYAIHSIFGITAYFYVTSKAHSDTSNLSLITKSIAMNCYILAALPVSAGLVSSIAALIVGDNMNVRYCYDSPLMSTSMESFWKRWSVQISEPLRDYVYIPFGGKHNFIVSVNASFLTNALAHCYLFGLQTRGIDWNFIGYFKSFSVISLGTIVDNYIKKYDNSSKLIFISRYALMLATLIGQLAFAWNDISFTKNAFSSTIIT